MKVRGVLLLGGVLAVTAVLPAQNADVVIDGRMHHLRSGADREWAWFPEKAEGASLRRIFELRAPAGEATLRLRHRDLKQVWRVLVNGTEVARLPSGEVDMTTYWTVGAGVLRDGTNELQILAPAGGASDDVMVGELAILGRARSAALAEGVVDVTVIDQASRQPMPARITISDERGSLATTGNESTATAAVRPGVVYTATGQVEIRLPAGRYVLYAGRGFEYGVASARVVIRPGAKSAERLVLRREVDTAGWAAMDTHIHTFTYAKHGDAAIDEQMHAIAGEGLELPVSAEHNVRVDFDEAARRTGGRRWFTPILGSEVTTSMGHFNVWPLPPAGPAIDARPADWAALRRSTAAAAPEAAVILNHGRDMHSKFRPLDPARHVGLTGERLDGQDLPVNAMEVVNSGAVQTDPLTVVEDWMALVNRGRRLVPVGSSDSHDVARHFVGQGRTYVRVEDADPGNLDLAAVTASFKAGRVLVSYGLLAEASVDGAGAGDLVRPGPGDVRVRVRVQGPAWVSAERVLVYASGVLVREVAIGNRAGAGTKWQGEVVVPRPRGDVHVVAVALGAGVRAPYWPTATPYQPTSVAFTPYTLGVSGAVFVDVDGSGQFDSAFSQAERLLEGVSDVRAAATRLAGEHPAVVLQAASLLRQRAPARFSEAVAVLEDVVPADVSRRLRAYAAAVSKGN